MARPLPSLYDCEATLGIATDIQWAFQTADAWSFQTADAWSCDPICKQTNEITSNAA